MCICVYNMYVYISSDLEIWASLVPESPYKRGLEYRVQAICMQTTLLREYFSTGDTGSGFLRKSTGANVRKHLFTKSYRHVVLFFQKSPNVSGNLREFTG